MRLTPFRWTTLACLLGLAGCLVPYCARSVNHLPPVDLNCDPQEVRAFCVSITRQTVREEGIKEIWELRQLEAGPKTPSQSKTSYDFGVYALSPGSGPGFLIDTTHALCLRLYRPGFKTVELDTVEPQDKVTWEPAKNVLDRETALDDLFGVTKVIVPKGDPEVVRTLEPGAKSKEHKAALQFGAMEYATLAGAMGDPIRDDLKEIKTRLIGKVARFQMLAAAGAPPKKKR
jgi:hypothetical protein